MKRTVNIEMKLTDRQLKTVDLLCEGKRVNDIALNFNCSKGVIERDLFWFKEYYNSKTLIQAISKHLI